MAIHQLKVKSCRKETANAVVISFEIPEELKAQYKFKPGQYLSLNRTINGQAVRRPYSICSSIDQEDISVLVKHLPGGLMSTALNTNLDAGETMEVGTPEGRFTLLPDHERSVAYYFIAAGSGITPILSMISSILENEPMSFCYLLYGSRTEEEILMKSELDQLLQHYEGQLQVMHTLSAQKSKGFLRGLWSSQAGSKNFKSGRIDAQLIIEFLEDFDNNRAKKYFICGPEEMIENSYNRLLGQGIDKKDIQREYFTAADAGNKTKSTGDGTKTCHVTLEGKEIEIKVNDSETILDAMMEAGTDPPYSCTSGACATCIAKVTSGEVVMDSCFSLDDDEVKDGMILTCQAHPVSEKVVLTYDV